MKKTLKAAVIGVTAFFVSANATTDGFFKYEVIDALQINEEISTNPNNPLWEKAKSTEVTLYPQVSVRLNDKKANELIPKKEAVKAQVKAIYNDKNIAVYIKWKDNTPSVQPPFTTNQFADGVSIEFPNKFGKGITLPYVGMGDENHPVTVYLQKNVAGRDYQKVFVSKGFGSLTEVDTKNVDIVMTYDEKNKEWTAVFKRPLTDEYTDLKAGLVPIAFAVWDGNQYERDGNKSLSRWKFIRLNKFELDKDYVEYVSWGVPYVDWPEKGEDIGDPENGKKLFQQNGCAACHRAAEFQTAPLGMAPDLSDIGGIANAIYLKESIINPNDVIIRNLNINRHYMKTNPDRFKAYPNNSMYEWYIKTDGKKQSKMPAFTHLQEQDINDLVAYLKTLVDWKNFK
ncbi:MAG: c-type cytochrome [Aquificae bacterium]|nr:c-type cytochrome [Aquificota bacterium]